KSRWLLVNGAALLGLNRPYLINRTSQHIHNASEGALTHGNGNRGACVGYLHSATHSITGAHGDGANHTVAQELLHLKSEVILYIVRVWIYKLKRIINLR